MKPEQVAKIPEVVDETIQVVDETIQVVDETIQVLLFLPSSWLMASTCLSSSVL